MSARLSGSGYADALGGDGAALADAAEGNLARRVSSCPEWDVADLVWHTGGVHHFWGEIVDRRLQSYEDVVSPQRPEDSALVSWFRAGVERLARRLRDADANATVWTWAPEKKVSFVQRRMAQETAVHRWDVESATGDVRPIDSRLAVDGVDEFLDFFLPWDRLGGGRDFLHLHSTDAPGEWVVTVENGRLDVRRAHERADVAVRGPASDLLLLLWRRIPP